jgi:hypothetical protein
MTCHRCYGLSRVQSGTNPGGSNLPASMSAAAAHASQSEALPALVRRLDLLGSGETLRWLRFPQLIPSQHEDQALVTA